ncbi:MAG: acetyltransferase [Lachnospiraceae bacterium]|nr:acetyltransferase [Lachnospiraceae bacterium]
MVLAIYGAGGLGREVLELAIAVEKKSPRWEGIVFLDDRDLGAVRGRRVVSFGSFRREFPKDSVEIAIAVGEPFTRKKLREMVKEAGYSMAVLVHPAAQVAADCTLMEGAVVHYNVFVSSGAVVGENSYLQPSCVVGHDVRIGRDCVISTFGVIAGSCLVGGQTYIGLSAAIKEQTRIGEGSIIGMGSVVMRDVEGNMVTMGNPAKAVRHNDDHKVF